MSIQALDWILYFAILFIMWWMFPRKWKEELGSLIGMFIILIYTIIYCIVFWFFSWSEIFKAININFEITW